MWSREHLVGHLGTAFVASLAAILVACGGGGGGGETPASAIVRDSFGQVVSEQEGFTPDDAGIDGTVASSGSLFDPAGARPMEGARVVLTDGAGREAETTTGAQGYYRLKVTGLQPPFLVRASVFGELNYRAIRVGPVPIGTFRTINVNALTEMIADDFARAAGLHGAVQLTPQIVAAGKASLPTWHGSLRTRLSGVLTSAGIDPERFDPVAVPFRADHAGHGWVLDHVSLIRSEEGVLDVRVLSHGTEPALPGAWQASGTRVGEEGEGDFGGGFSPQFNLTASDLAQFNAVDMLQRYTSHVGGLALFSGDSVTDLGRGTRFTSTVTSFGFSDYQGCGQCEVGSSVAYTETVTLVQGGTIGGQAFAEKPTQFTTRFRITRLQ